MTPAIPSTLHGQLALLTYDRRHHRFDGDQRPRYGLALRAAMLTDLFISGHLRDRGGRPWPVDVGGVEDAVLRAALDDVRRHDDDDWATAVLRDSHESAPEAVRRQLEDAGWLQVELHQRFGLLPSFPVRLADPEAVAALAVRTRAAVRSAIDGHGAEERPLVVGLLGALGRLPTVFPFHEAERHYTDLYHLTYYGPPPLAGMLAVIERDRVRPGSTPAASSFRRGSPGAAGTAGSGSSTPRG